MSQIIRLIIADDHIMVREGLVALLADEADIDVVGQASNGQEAVSLVHQCRPHVALLDIKMPDQSGLEAANEISSECPWVKVLILTMHEEEAFFFEALQAGAIGYILKGAPSEDLIKAVRIVSKGEVYLSSHFGGALVDNYLNSLPHPKFIEKVLTPRETEILMLILNGLTNQMIADQLTVSLNTIKTHRTSIYKKLNLCSRAELVSFALHNGLFRSEISPPVSANITRLG